MHRHLWDQTWACCLLMQADQQRGTLQGSSLPHLRQLIGQLPGTRLRRLGS
jgi:hypothetical protein